MEVTRKGYYTITGPDGQPLTKADGTPLRVTSRDECYERITADDKEYAGPKGTYVISCPDREVLRTNLSFSQILPVDPVAPDMPDPDPGPPPWDYPIVVAAAIGGGTPTAKWSQTAPMSQTWQVAAHDIATVNFIFPNDGFPNTHATSIAGVANLRSLNPVCIVGSYTDKQGISETNAYSVANYFPPLDTDWFDAGINGAADGDGLSRLPDGTLASPDTGANEKWIPNQTTYPGFGDGSSDPTVYGYSTSGRYPTTWMMLNKWYEWWSVEANLDLDFMYVDVLRWTLRSDEEGTVDLDRDNTADPYDWDASIPGSYSESIGLAYTQGLQAVKDEHLAAYGSELMLGGNSTGIFDFFQGGRADTGPNFLTAATQPAGWQSLLDYGYFEHWGRLLGYNDDGTDRASGNFTRAAKIACRAREYYQTNFLTGTKLIMLMCNLDRVTTALTTQQQLAIFRYFASASTLFGGACTLEQKTLHQEVKIMDEYIAGDIENMTIAEIEAAKHWLGQPVGTFPAWDLNATGEAEPNFVQGVTGGVIQDGVWGMEFEGGLVVVNPKDNGAQTITLPSGNWSRFVGAQSPAVNDGSVVDTTLDLNDAEGLFLERSAGGADFLARATASSNVLYATNFNDVYLLGVKDNLRSGISDTAGVFAEAFNTPGNDQLDWNTDQTLSGAGSLRMWRNDSDGTGTSGSWGFRPDGDKSGTQENGTEYRRSYFQFAVYMSREFLAWRADDTSSPKIMKAFNDQFFDGEIPVINRKYSGFVSLQMNNPTEQVERELPDAGAADAFTGVVKMFQPELYPSGNLNGLTATQALTLAGPLLDRDGSGQSQFGDAGGDYSYISGDEWLDLRASIIANGGFPNANASVNGVPWNMDGWTVIELFCDFDANPKRFMAWAAHYGDAPTLVADTSGVLKEFGNVANYNQATTQSTQQQAETGVRPLSYRWYDEFICGTDPIKFPNPGGVPHSLPGNLGGLGGTSALADAAAGLAAGGSDTFTQEPNFTKDDLAWQTTWWQDEINGVIHLMGKPQNLPNQWAHQYYTIADDTWTLVDSAMAWNKSGHIYGNTAFDDVAGELYQLANNALFRYQFGVGWSQVSTIPVLAGGDHANGLAFSPNLYGAGVRGLLGCTKGSLQAYDIVAGDWDAVSEGFGATEQRKAGCGDYLANIDTLIIGNGESASLSHYLVTRQSVASTDAGPPPLKTHGGSHASVNDFGTVVRHPSDPTRMLLLERRNSNLYPGSGSRVWQSTDLDVWTNTGYTHPFDGSYTVCAVESLGVLWAIGYATPSTRMSTIWKPNT